MRWLLLALSLAALSASAFDSEAWLGRRDAYGAEAERMAGLFAKYEALSTSPAENIELPVETWPDGSVRVSVGARQAQFFLNEGFLWGRGVKLSRYREDGSLEAQIDAEDCLVDRVRRSGWAQGLATAKYGDEVRLEGRRVYFSFTNRYVRIGEATRLDYGKDRLASRTADYDQEAGVIMFDGDVKVRHDERGEVYDVAAARAFAFLVGTNDLRRIVALGGVTVAGAGREGDCARAVYQRGAGKLTMYGSETAAARLAETGEHRRELRGSRIVMWLDSQQIEVIDPQLTVETDSIKLPNGY